MKTQQGFALIEVLVTALILAVGVMGMAGLQMKAAQFNQASYFRSQANILAYDIMERMRMNRSFARLGNYDVAFGTASVTGSTLAQTDVQAWLTSLSGTLPGGQGHIACTSTTCTVEVRWKESADANAVSGQENWILATYNTRI